MKAAVLREVGQPLAIEDVEISKPGPREVLIRTAAAGVCHSDLHFIEGHYPTRMPIVLGHESAGIVEQGRRIAASLLEADEIDIVLDTSTGTFHVAGTPAVSTDWAAIAAAAGDEGLVEATTFKTSGATYPFGAHVAVVEVDAGTGKVTHLRHIACDDAGTMVNPMLLAGQVHGGVAQGTAQALYEEVRYDADGNPVTSNLADYTMISADLMPTIERIPMETPTFVNPLGAKGIGESGTIGSTPAVHSAVIDALSHLGVRHIDMPCTPEKVWQAMNAAS